MTDFATLIRLLCENEVEFILGLERLIAVKRAAGRPKDLETIAELERIQQESQGTSES